MEEAVLAENLASFKYTALNAQEIRLIIIAPGNNNEQVSCTLINLDCNEIAKYSVAASANLSDTRIPPDDTQRASLRTDHIDDLHGYEALSYTWDSDAVGCHQMRNIKLNNCAFQITENLESALRQLRHKNPPRAFWIDAVCINQSDELEKEQQVKIMHEIYRNARHVVIWLGPATLDIKMALDFAETRYRMFDPTTEHLREERWSGYPDPPKRLRMVEQSLFLNEHLHEWRFIDS